MPSNYDFSKLNPFKGRKRRNRRQVQSAGKGSTSIQSGGDIYVNGEKYDEFGPSGSEPCSCHEKKFTSGQLLSIIGFIALTVCTTFLEVSGGDGGGLWILVVLWGMSLGNI